MQLVVYLQNVLNEKLFNINSSNEIFYIIKLKKKLPFFISFLFPFYDLFYF